jgi:galactose mutarotase-like enzyme
MSHLFGRNWTRRELMERVGDISQLGGIRNLTLNDGNENGVRAVEVRTGRGFRFVVLPDRGMDISEADHAGRSLCWRSSTGDVAPAFFEPQGVGWLRGFFGGLLATCGLTYVGPPGTDEGEPLGLHGRITYVPARNVYANGEWQGDEYVMWVQGKVSEASAVAPKITLNRKISTRLGATSLSIEDTIENEGYAPSPFMMLYHINFGFPVVSRETVLLSPSKNVVTVAREKVGDPDLYRRFHDPVAGFQQMVFRHEMVPDPEGYVTAALVKRGSDALGAYVRYRLKELPHFWQWKMLGAGVYTVALEPANCWVGPRSEARQRGELTFLQPGEVVRQHVRIGVCTSVVEIEELERSIPPVDVEP